jgi:phage-related minor tail protein
MQLLQHCATDKDAQPAVISTLLQQLHQHQQQAAAHTTQLEQQQQQAAQQATKLEQHKQEAAAARAEAASEAESVSQTPVSVRFTVYQAHPLQISWIVYGV